MARGRGGYQRPSKPAAASGPGSLSKRTDGRQPVRAPAGGSYGDRKELEDAQRAQPLPAEGGPPGSGPAGGGGRGGGIPPDGIFGATGRPDEPMTAGVPFGPGADGDVSLVGSDPVAEIRAVYKHFPSPALRRLIDRADQRAQRG